MKFFPFRQTIQFKLQIIAKRNKIYMCLSTDIIYDVSSYNYLCLKSLFNSIIPNDFNKFLKKGTNIRYQNSGFGSFQPQNTWH